LRLILGIELFDFRLGQDIQSTDTKNGTKGKIKPLLLEMVRTPFLHESKFLAEFKKIYKKREFA
jgi:hypothetical protein